MESIYGVPVTRFWSKVEQSDGCWLWTASLDKHGYGRMWGVEPTKRVHRAHRASWVIHHGPIPEGMAVCHACDNPRCVRPDHLFLGTRDDNMADMWAKGRGVDPPPAWGRRHAARLSDEQAGEVRARHAAGERQIDLAAAYGVSQTTISRIVHRRGYLS